MTSGAYLRTHPPRIMRARAGFLALSPDDSNLRIGVVGATEDEALSRYDDAVEAWQALRALPFPDGWAVE